MCRMIIATTLFHFTFHLTVLLCRSAYTIFLFEKYFVMSLGFRLPRMKCINLCIDMFSLRKNFWQNWRHVFDSLLSRCSLFAVRNDTSCWSTPAQNWRNFCASQILEKCDNHRTESIYDDDDSLSWAIIFVFVPHSQNVCYTKDQRNEMKFTWFAASSPSLLLLCSHFS